ncbi:hypothetical protein SAMN06296273_0708 [Nitrosomonas ureae]|uniref:Helix-turn-helix domain-containing protein n=2 Tax=Nitrosomonas ureae TaxID=44577 RepID=A0A285BWI7_9PROT|nr:hypothetical protein SAMN06296273_0708 [Nitrosomonas ureae]
MEQQISHIHAASNVSVALDQLAKLAIGRDHIQTDEIARVTNHKPQTVRKKYCLTGEYFGIRPVKLGNRLLWPVADIAKLLNGGI